MSTEVEAYSWTPKWDGYRQKQKKILKTILNDRKIRLINIADTPMKCAGYIVHEYLNTRKLCEKKLSRKRTFDQKQNELTIRRGFWCF